MLVIAIDGPAGSGKSTVGRQLAARLGLTYLDTGAMYRAVAFAAIRQGVDPADPGPVAALARAIDIRVGDDGVFVDDIDATLEIRGPEVTRAVSLVAANPEVRTELRARQRQWAAERGGGVIEGRDIGSVVFPDALLKVYLTASEEVRAARRAKEMTDLRYDEVAADIARRDAADSGRADSPLTEADDAVVVDTSGLSIEGVVDLLSDLVARRSQGPMSGTGATPTPSAAPQATVPHKRLTRPRTELQPLRPWAKALYAVFRVVVTALARLGWRFEVSGRDRLPTVGPFVLAPVHRSNLDFLLAGLAVGRRARFMTKDTIWKAPRFGKFIEQVGAFPVDRDNPDRGALRKAEASVAMGDPVVMFPEGTRREGPVVEDLFDGPAWVACRQRVPLVPMAIGGADKAMPIGSKRIRFSKVRVVIGEPIYPAVPLTGRVPRRIVSEVTEQLRKDLQALHDEVT